MEPIHKFDRVNQVNSCKKRMKINCRNTFQTKVLDDTRLPSERHHILCTLEGAENYDNMAKTKRKRSENTQQDFKIERL
jgi:hypothetical protein